MAPLAPDCPAIHVAFTALADEGLFHWIAVGAEEEEVPCRQVTLQEPGDVLELAYATARNSRLNVGLAVDRGEIVLHEVHMPERQPVLRFRFDGQAPAVCRLMGCNAARLIVRRPFRFPEAAPLTIPPNKTNDEQIAALAADAIEAADAAQATEQTRVVTYAPSPAPEKDLDQDVVVGIVAAILRELEEGGIPS